MATKETALLRVVAKASKTLAESGDIDAPIGQAVWDCLLDVVGRELGNGVPPIVEREVECGRLDVGADGQSVVYYFDIQEYARRGRQGQ